MSEEKGKGQVLNHSSKELFIFETDSGPPIVHRLGPKRKSPSSVDADGFRRADGESILLHSSWWKIPDGFRADIYQLGNNVLIPVSVMAPVRDLQFGNYEIREEANWGEELVYVTGILKDKRRRTTGYLVEGRGEIAVAEAIALATEGGLDNVVIVKHKNGHTFLRTKRNAISDDNLTA